MDDYNAHVLRDHRMLRDLVLTGGYYTIRHFARAYVDRTSGPRAGARFLRHADLILIGAFAQFAVIFGVACWVSFASLGVAIGLFFLAMGIALAMIAPSAYHLLEYAAREVAYRREHRGPLTARAYATARDYLPRMFP